MRNKSDLDTMSMYVLYNNMKLYVAEIKIQSSSSSNSQNVAFVSLENTSSTNEAVNSAYEVSTANSQGQASSSSYADDVMFSFFVSQSNSQQLDNEYLEHIDTDDLEEMELKCFDKTKVEFYNYHRRGHFVRECGAPTNQGNRNRDVPRRIIPVETPANSLFVQDGIGSSSSSISDSEVPTCSKACLKSYESLKEHIDKQKEQLNKSNLEIIGYQLGLESLEARIVVHQKNEAIYEEDIAFSKYDVKVRDNSITELKNQLAEALREKDDLKLKLEKFETSSKKLTDLLNSQISVNNKTSIGFDNQMTENELHDIDKNNSKVCVSASDSSVYEIKEENNQVNDRFKKVEGYHVVPPPYTRNYMSSRPDLSAGLDDSVYKTNVSKIIISVPRNESTASKSSKDDLEQPKDVMPSAPITKECESDSDDDCVIKPSFKQNKPSYAKINFGKSNENTRKSVIEQNTYRQAENLRKSQINIVKQSSSRAAISNSTARYVNTAASRPSMNGAKPCSNVFHKSHSSVKRTIYQRTTPKNSDFKEKVNTAKLLDESQVLLKVPRQNNMYSFNLKNVVPSGGLTCLFAKATIDESNLWHRRLGHVNFKTMNKLVRGNLVRGLPSKLFENEHTCVACQKGKCDNRTEFKNSEMNQFCEIKGIKREFSVARTPQQNGAEAINTACYVQNRALITKPHNKTPYELLIGRSPNLNFMRPFGCPVTILNTLDHLGKFEGKADEGFLVGYSINSSELGSKLTFLAGSELELASYRFWIPDHLCLIGLTLHHGNNEFDCIVGVKRMGVNILKSIDEAPFQMGTFRETLVEGTEGALHLGLKRPRVYSDMSPEDKERLISKFVNNMLPEWGRFVTAVKLKEA
ncbi:ribonuclease H-like domain-containing protein [Tanacetum coccineum]